MIVHIWIQVLANSAAILAIVGIIWAAGVKWSNVTNEIKEVAGENKEIAEDVKQLATQIKTLIEKKDSDHVRLEAAISSIAEHQHKHDEWHLGQLRRGRRS